MYLDLSFKKILFVVILLAVLLTAVAYTLAAKVNYFGTTPYGYTAFLGTRYAIDTALDNLETLLPRMYSAAMIALGKSTSDKETSSSPAHAIPVITYHRIVTDPSDHNNVSVARFKDQMTTLKAAGWNTVTLADFEAFMQGEKELPERSFLLTFDDGAKESFYPVDPILASLNYHAVMFVIAQSADNAENLGSVYYLSPPEIQRMIKSGRWDIGSHSFDGHRPYPVDAEGATGIFFADRLWSEQNGRLETPDEFTARVQDDLSHAKQDLESEYGVPINSFAFPLGNETGQHGANNFPEGSAITARIASTIYQFGFLQLDNQNFTDNFPRTQTPSLVPDSPPMLSPLSDPFDIRRIHVDYDWDGKRLLSILENSLPKALPYQDDFTIDNGWIQAWGILGIGRNNFTLTGAANSNGASTFLDGTALWDNYSLDASLNWHTGEMFMLADVVDANTYDACAFSPGRIRVLSTKNGVVTELSNVADPRIQYGDTVRMGVRVHGDDIECTWSFQAVAESYARSFSGGIGFQLWDQKQGASVQISSLIARSLDVSATQQQPQTQAQSQIQTQQQPKILPQQVQEQPQPAQQPQTTPSSSEPQSQSQPAQEPQTESSSTSPLELILPLQPQTGVDSTTTTQ